jgi:hypothetical protein
VNSFEPINPALIDVVLPEDGYPPEMAAEDTPDALWDAAGDAAREFPAALWIEPRDWADKARENDKYKTWASNYVDRFTNQAPTHECTTHALRCVYEAAHNRQRGIQVGPPIAGQRLPISATSHSVWFSCLSIYAEANPRQRGGASTRGVMEIAARRGMLPDRIQPRAYNFPHTLTGTAGRGGVNQSAGAWVQLSRFPSGWQNTAKLFRPLEVIIPRIWEQTVCLLLHGRAVGHGRSGHAVPLVGWNVASSVAPYLDSYDVIRYDSVANLRAGLVSAYCIESVTVPDNWDDLFSLGVGHGFA